MEPGRLLHRCVECLRTFDPAVSTVDVHVAYLRRKLGKQVIRTVPGKGYLVPSD